MTIIKVIYESGRRGERGNDVKDVVQRWFLLSSERLYGR
jgi:hypothetical protein